MRNLANYISVSRIIMSIMLAITETFSIAFYIIYIYCGISDMLDGFIAPFLIVYIDPIILEIIICRVATFAAVQEGKYLRAKNTI